MVDMSEDEEIRRLAACIWVRTEPDRPDDPEEEWFTAEHRIIPEELAGEVVEFEFVPDP